jgi:hypothetical protein
LSGSASAALPDVTGHFAGFEVGFGVNQLIDGRCERIYGRSDGSASLPVAVTRLVCRRFASSSARASAVLALSL